MSMSERGKQVETRSISEIVVVGRHRKELGDLAALAASIEAVGLLHPPVITADNRLVAGQRRLEACRLLGWSVIPVTVAANLADAFELLTAERDENTCRLPMTPSEAVSIGRALEELERPRAEARMVAGIPSENFTEGRSTKGNTRDIVGAAVGMSGPTYDRAKAVVLASEDETLPEEAREAAKEAKEEMDRTGKVTPAFNKVAHLTGRKGTDGGGKPATTTKEKTRSPRRIGPGAEARRLADFERAYITLVEVCTAADQIAIPANLTAERLEEIDRELNRAAQAVQTFRRRIKEKRA